MATVRNEADRKGLVERLGRMRPESKAQWGQFDAPRMMCHLGDALEEALGDGWFRGRRRGYCGIFR